jgi:chaperonin cofactor prefoldin
MALGIKEQMGLDAPAKASSEKQSKDFQAAFQAQLNSMNGHLQYTATHAEEGRHNALAGRRDALIASFQATLGQIDPANPAKAKGAIDKVLANARAVNGDIGNFRKEAEKAFNDWTSHQPHFDEAVQQVEELEKWEDPKAAALRGLVDGIRKQVNERKYAAACKTFDQLAPKLKPIYEEYLKQREAKAKYDPALAALQPKLTEATAGHYAKLKPMQDDIAGVQKDMEAAAQKKDFVQALKLVAGLGTKVDAYSKAFTELEQQKKKYDEAWSDLQPKLDDAAKVDYPKLVAQKAELATGRTNIETAVQGEDYAQALKLTKELEPKADAFAKAVEELERQKKEYEDTLKDVQPKLAEVSKSSFRKVEPMVNDLAAVQEHMEAAAKENDYEKATQHVKDLSSKVETIETTLQDLEKQKKAFDEASAPLKPRLAKAAESTDEKMKSLQNEIAGLQKEMEGDAEAEEFEKGAKVCDDLSKKLDDFEKGEPGDGSKMVIPVEQTVKLHAPLELNGIYAKLSAELAIKLKGSLEVASSKDKPARSTDVAPLGYSDGLVLRVGETWYSEQGASILGVQTTIIETKVVGEGKVVRNDKDPTKSSIEFSLAGSVKFANGEEVKIKFTVVKIGDDDNGTVSGPGCEVSYTFKSVSGKVKLDTASFSGALQLSIAGKVQPNYAALGKMLAEKVGTRVAQIASSALTAEAMIAAGFAAGAAMTIFAVVKGISDGADVRRLHSVSERITNEMTNGFIAGAQGQGSPGGLGEPGYVMGQRGFAALKQHVLAKVPDATDAEVREVAAKIIAGKNGQVWSAMNPHAQQAVWQQFANEHRGDKQTLRDGHINLYGRMPSDNDPNFTKYLDD